MRSPSILETIRMQSESNGEPPTVDAFSRYATPADQRAGQQLHFVCAVYACIIVQCLVVAKLLRHVSALLRMRSDGIALQIKRASVPSRMFSSKTNRTRPAGIIGVLRPRARGRSGRAGGIGLERQHAAVCCSGATRRRRREPVYNVLIIHSAEKSNWLPSVALSSLARALFRL